MDLSASAPQGVNLHVAPLRFHFCPCHCTITSSGTAAIALLADSVQVITLRVSAHDMVNYRRRGGRRACHVSRVEDGYLYDFQLEVCAGCALTCRCNEGRHK